MRLKRAAIRDEGYDLMTPLCVPRSILSGGRCPCSASWVTFTVGVAA
jgi:hypothetical protein